MKRALAERAKGDNLAPDLSISDTSHTQLSRLSKTPRLLAAATSDAAVPAAAVELETGVATTAVGPSASVVLSSASSPSLTLQAHTVISSTSLPTGSAGNSANDDETSDRAYYLQYQNRALVGELHRLKHVVQTLEQERLARRTQCDMARQCVDMIHGMWCALENSLAGTIMKSSSSLTGRLEQQQGWGQGGGSISFISSSSSGEGTNVETISGLLRALSYLAARSPSSASSSNVEGNLDTSIKNEDISPSSTSSSFNLQTTLTGVQTRVNNLQSMIVSLLGAVLSKEVDTNMEKSVMPPSSLLTEYTDLVTKVSTLQGQLDAFHLQLEEISASRDDALLREKRIRRYLFRIMAGQEKEDVLRVSQHILSSV